MSKMKTRNKNLRYPHSKEKSQNPFYADYQRSKAPIYFEVDTEREEILLNLVIEMFLLTPNSFRRNIFLAELNRIIGKRIKEEDISILYIRRKKID